MPDHFGDRLQQQCHETDGKGAVVRPDDRRPRTHALDLAGRERPPSRADGSRAEEVDRRQKQRRVEQEVGGVLHADRQSTGHEVDADMLIAQECVGHRRNEDDSTQHVGDVERPKGRRVKPPADDHLVAHDDDENRRHDHGDRAQQLREQVDDGEQPRDHAHAASGGCRNDARLLLRVEDADVGSRDPLVLKGEIRCRDAFHPRIAFGSLLRRRLRRPVAAGLPNGADQARDRA